MKKSGNLRKDEKLWWFLWSPPTDAEEANEYPDGPMYETKQEAEVALKRLKKETPNLEFLVISQIEILRKQVVWDRGLADSNEKWADQLEAIHRS